MPGAIPSGDDPSGYTAVDGSIVGALMGGLNTRTEDNVKAAKSAELQSSPGYNNSSNLVFAGLNGALGLVGGIAKAILQTVTGVPLQIIGGIGQGIGNILGAFLGIPASQITDGPTSNLITNPQFNVDLTGWAASDAQCMWSATEGNATVGAARIQANGVEHTLTSVRIPAAVGHKLTVKASRKVVNGSWTGAPVRVLLDVYNASDSVLTTVVVNSATGATTGWVTVTGEEYTCPMGTSYVKVRLNVLATMGLGDVLFDDVSLVKAGQIAQNALNLGSLFGYLWTGLTGIFGGGAGSAAPQDIDLGNAQGAQRDVVASIAAAVARLQDQLADSDPTTNLIQDDFEYVNTSGPDPTLWDVKTGGFAIAGHAEVDGHQVIWNAPGGGGSDHHRMYFFKGTNSLANSDYGSARIILGDELTQDACFESIIGRCNADNTKFLELRKYRSSIALFWVDLTAGTTTQIGNTISFNGQPGAGSTLQFTWGNKALNQPREFTVDINTSSFTITDPTAISSVGANFRKRGFSVYAGTVVFLGFSTQNKPGRIAHWASTETPS